MGASTGTPEPGDALRVGVTGHRSFADVDAVTNAIDAVLERLAPDDTTTITVVSSLAEGADRLVVDRVLRRPHGALEVILPLAGDDYADDFTSDASRRQFSELLATASSVEVAAAGDRDRDPDFGWSRQEAYERAGRAVVDRCDALIAVWDGEQARGRGGTAEIVHYAIDRGVAVEVVLVRRPEPA